MATCRQCAYLRKCIDKATKGGYEHNVDFDPKNGCTGWGFKSKTAADTNADRIRAMSDEEIALWLCLNYSCTKCPGKYLCTINDGKHNGLTKWLKQPVGVDNVDDKED